MRSPWYSITRPMNLILSMILLSSQLSTAYTIPHRWQKTAWSKSSEIRSRGQVNAFQDLGHVNTTAAPDIARKDPLASSDYPTLSSAYSDPEEAAMPDFTSQTASNLPQSSADPIDPLPGNDTFSNLTTLNTTDLAEESAANTCSTLPSWYTPNFDMIKPRFITDCYLVVQQLYLSDVHFNHLANTPLEFAAPPGSNGLAPGFKHTTSLDEIVEQTPIIYEANTCTLAIMMLSTFINVTNDRSQLPGNFKQTSSMRNTDMTTWHKLHTEGRMVESECLRRLGRAGWTPAGDDGDMGVFLWVTGSQIDDTFRTIFEPSSNRTQEIPPPSQPEGQGKKGPMEDPVPQPTESASAWHRTGPGR